MQGDEDEDERGYAATETENEAFVDGTESWEKGKKGKEWKGESVEEAIQLLVGRCKCRQQKQVRTCSINAHASVSAGGGDSGRRLSLSSPNFCKAHQIERSIDGWCDPAREQTLLTLVYY